MRDLKEIVEILKSNNVKGYKVSKDLDGAITEYGVNKILNGESKKPRNVTIGLLNYYIDHFIETSTSNTKLLDNKSEFPLELPRLKIGQISKQDIEACLYIIRNHRHLLMEREEFVRVLDTERAKGQKEGLELAKALYGGKKEKKGAS